MTPLANEQQQATLSGVNLGGPTRLMHAVWPLVRLLQQDDLSWCNRVQIADAIMSTLLHYEGMEAEQRYLQGAAGQAMPPASAES